MWVEGGEQIVTLCSLTLNSCFLEFKKTSSNCLFPAFLPPALKIRINILYNNELTSAGYQTSPLDTFRLYFIQTKFLNFDNINISRTLFSCVYFSLYIIKKILELVVRL